LAEGLRSGGVYVLTGGFGNIGLKLAGWLARTTQAKLALIGRKTPPERGQWEEWVSKHGEQEETSARIEQLRELERQGSKVLMIRADVSDKEQMERALQEVERELGAVDGVIHAAGAIGATPISELSRRQCEEQFCAKVRGLYVLEEVLRQRQPRFCVLMSSLSAVLGGLGFGAYAAANAFMDVFAHRQNQRSQTAWLSVNWDGWRFGAEKAERQSKTMSAEEGVEVFGRVLSLKTHTDIVVSVRPLEERLEQWVHFGRAAAEERSGSHGLHPRPQLSTVYAPPVRPVEEQLAKIWQELLGVERIGIHDNFFELGGHSLLATQLISRVRTVFGVEMPLRSFFESATIASFAAVNTLNLEEREKTKQAELLKLVAQLSENQVEAELSKRGIKVDLD
jgi:NAD(P)-dependent dehydrogenase (short-subunit alcohol dehydrogenase family)/acyl carrier protein